MQQTVAERQRFWRDHLTAWRQSGQTLKAYAEAHGLRVAQLYHWNRRLKRVSPLVAVQIRDAAASGLRAPHCRVVLPGGLTLDWPIDAEPARLRALIDALGPRP